jgi:acylphosphatase
MIRKHIIVKGRVQGVGFRYFTQKIAYRFNIKGFVRNTSDGHVEIDAEATEEDMKNFIKLISMGNNFSGVERLEQEIIKEPENYKYFNIKY